MVTILIWVAIVIVAIFILNQLWLKVEIKRVKQPRNRDCFIIYYGNKNRTHMIL